MGYAALRDLSTQRSLRCVWCRAIVIGWWGRADLQLNEVPALAVTGLWVISDLQLLYGFQSVMLCAMS